MQRICKAVVFTACITLPLVAGALTLQIGSSTANAEARGKNAVAIVQVLACRSPDKTTVTASAIGMIDGKQQTISLRVLALSKPGMYAVTREWQKKGDDGKV